MKVFAPQLRALITILRSTGPVISTRLSCRSAGQGLTRQVLSARMPAVSARKVGQDARVELLLPFGPACQQRIAARAELALQPGDKSDRFGGQYFQNSLR